MGLPYSERRAALEGLDLNGPHWTTPETFEEGAALRYEMEREGAITAVKRRPRAFV
jgi:hypothetical protein